MEFLKRLAAAVAGRGRRQEALPAKSAEAPSGQGPVERTHGQGKPELTEQKARLWAERADFAFAKHEELSARGTRVAETVESDPMERLTLLCRRCASDIAAQDDLR